MNGVKRCSKCFLHYPLAYFHRKGIRRGTQQYSGRCRSCYKKDRVSYTQKSNSEIYTIRMKKYQKKVLARIWFNHYLKKHPEIKKNNCESCGGFPVEGHHFDYKKPFEVVWLCRTCHTNIHYPLKLAGEKTK